MPRRPEIGNVQLYPNRPLRSSDRNGYVLKFYCPIRNKRIRRNTGTRDRREARRILRECRERLLNGSYVESDGAITQSREVTRTAIAAIFPESLDAALCMSWEECLEEYKAKHLKRTRSKSHEDTVSRLHIAERILAERRKGSGLPGAGTIEEFSTLEALEYVQERLLQGDEGNFEFRSRTTVNSMMGAVMAFVRFCKARGWVGEVPRIERLPVDEVMKGRPIATNEYEAMLTAVPEVVGRRSAGSWRRVLEILWESAFRVGELMDFSWDNETKIHPVWPTDSNSFPTLAIPSSQKNKKVQEIPMLPGLQKILEQTPQHARRGWVVNPEPVEYSIDLEAHWCKPTQEDLAALAAEYTNSAIARGCGVSEATVRKWVREAGIRRGSSRRTAGEVPTQFLREIRSRAASLQSFVARRSIERLTKQHVGRIISAIGREAGIVVQQPETGRRLKFASAHDIRRACAHRLINAGVSAETLKLVMRHSDFSTTERFYGATRAAQSAAAEIHQRLASRCTKSELVGGLVGGVQEPLELSPEERKKLKALLDSL